MRVLTGCGVRQALAVRNRVLRLTAENAPCRLILRKCADSEKRLARADALA